MIKKTNKRALTDEQVQEIRSAYWLDGETYLTIANDYNVTERTIRNAVQSVGSYAEVPDLITKTQKENRIHPNTITGDYAGLAKKRKQRALDVMAMKAEDERIKEEREKENDPFRQAYPRSFS